MDKPRQTPVKKHRSLVLLAIAALSCAVLLTVLRPAEASVERSSLVIAEVTAGPFVHEITASGTLVAEQARLIAAPAAGRVEAIRVQPGDRLQKGDGVLVLSNRESLRELLEAEQQLSAAGADLADLQATLQARSLESEKLVRRTQFEKEDAERQAAAMEEMARQGVISSLESTRARESAVELTARVESERQRHGALERSAHAQLAAQRDRLDRLHALVAFHQGIVDSLSVRSPGSTTVRDVSVEEGEWVTEGQRMVRLVEPGRLKGVLLVPEAVAHDVRIGQRVTMNARGLELRGEVNRVAAAVDEGTLSVEVQLLGDVPSAARPELSVEGRIAVAKVDSALSITRPARAQSATASWLYRVEPSATRAHRVPVRYGPASADRIVIASGARTGDRFIVSGLESSTDQLVRLK